MGNPKNIAFELVEREPETEPYRIMREVRRDFHPDTADAQIAIAWRKGYKPDPEGHIILGQCVKASDLQREFVDLDFIILLNKEIWNDLQFTPDMKKALIDHELSHAAMAYDSEGDPKIDVRGRPVWRLRSHDIGEFIDIVRRHGTYKRDLQLFAESLIKKKNPVFPELETSEPALSHPALQMMEDSINKEEEDDLDPDNEMEGFDPDLDKEEELVYDDEPAPVKKHTPKELADFHADEVAKEKRGPGRPKKVVEQEF